MYRKMLIAFGIVCFLSSVRAKADDFVYASCPLGEGYVFLYDTPTGFQVVANLKCGQKVTVLGGGGNDRVQVRTADGKEGYVLKSTIVAALPGPRQQGTATASTGSQQPQAQPPVQPQPPAPPKPAQPAAQPPQAQAKLEVPLPAQPEVQAQAEPQSEPQPQMQSQAQDQLALEAKPKAQPETQLQPQAQPEPPAQAQPQLQAELEAQPEAQPQPQPELRREPPPAAVAFTPYSRLGYGRNVPRLEFFGGASYMNAGTNELTSRQNVIGFEGSVAINANRWLGGELNLSGYYKTIDIVNVATVSFRDYAAMAGPRLNTHKAFFHVLVGIDHLAGVTNFYAVNSSPDNVLAGAAGGGVQWNVARQLALRTSADYVMSRFGGVMQNNFRVTLGVVFQAGSVRSE